MELSVSCTAETAVTVPEETEKVFDFRSGRQFLLHFMDGVVQLQARAENEAVCLFQVALDFRSDIVPGKAYAVQPYYPGGVAVHNDEGAYVLYDFGHAAHHGAGADFYELVDSAHAADDGMAFHRYVAGCAGETGHDDVVSEIAVMGHMGIGLEHIIGADPCFTVFAGGSVDGYIFTNQVMVSNDYGAVFIVKFEILRVFADDCMGINMVFLSHTHIFGNDRVSADDGAFSDFTVLADDRIGLDDYIFMNHSGRINDCRGMNLRFCRFNDF